MKEKSNNTKRKKNKANLYSSWINLKIEILLALITVVSVPSAIDALLSDEISIFIRSLIIVISFVVIVALFFDLFIKKISIIKKNDVAESEYIREQKINQINKALFDSLYHSNSTKIRGIFRYTYGRVPEWNPINYRDNVLVYDVHEHIRSILISMAEMIISIDSKRFNDNNVSVELVYCYPNDEIINLPINMTMKKNPSWKLISSGDTSGNHQSVLEHLCQDNSFFTLVDCCGTVFKNNKFSDINKYQKALVDQRFIELDKRSPSDMTFFVRDIRDCECSKDGKHKGTAIGTIINIRNDNPERIFVKAILTINTYGEPIFVDVADNECECQGKDKFYLSEEDYKNIFCDTILSTYKKLLETELAQMYIRHSIHERNICPRTGRKTPVRCKNGCQECVNCSVCSGLE